MSHTRDMYHCETVAQCLLLEVTKSGIRDIKRLISKTLKKWSMVMIKLLPPRTKKLALSRVSAAVREELLPQLGHSAVFQIRGGSQVENPRKLATLTQQNKWESVEWPIKTLCLHPGFKSYLEHWHIVTHTDNVF